MDPYPGLLLWHDLKDAGLATADKTDREKALEEEVERQKTVIKHLMESIAIYQQCKACKRKASGHNSKKNRKRDTKTS